MAALPLVDSVTKESVPAVQAQLAEIQRLLDELAADSEATAGLDLTLFYALEERIRGLEQEQLIFAWAWIDELEALDPETGALMLPGDEAAPVSFEEITAVLPAAILAQLEAGEQTLPLAAWHCDEYPAEGAFQGTYTFRADLPAGFTLSPEAAPLTVTVQFDDATTMATSGDIVVLNSDGTVYNYYDSFEEAAQNANGKTIKLIDCHGKTVDCFECWNSFTLDLNGQSLAFYNAGAMVTLHGNVNIINTAAQQGEIESFGNDNTLFYIISGGVTIGREGKADDILLFSNNGSGINCAGGGTYTVAYGGQISTKGTCIKASGGTSVTLNGIKLTSSQGDALYVEGGAAYVNSGEFIGTHGIKASDNFYQIIISGGIFRSNSSQPSFYMDGKGKVEISGGTFEGLYVAKTMMLKRLLKENYAFLKYTEGSDAFTSSLTNQITDSVSVTYHATHTFKGGYCGCGETQTAVVIAADGTKTGYDSLSSACYYVSSGGTIRLLKDVAAAEGESFTLQNCTLDLNGKTLSGNTSDNKTLISARGNVTILNSAATPAALTNGGTWLISVNNGASLTIGKSNGSQSDIVFTANEHAVYAGENTTTAIYGGSFNSVLVFGTGSSFKLYGGTYGKLQANNLSLPKLLGDNCLFYKNGNPISTNGIVPIDTTYNVYKIENVSVGKHNYHVPDATTLECDCGKKIVATVTVNGIESGYETFTEAVAAVTTNGSTVKLLQDVDVGSTQLTVNNAITLDLNGYTITGNSNTSGSYYNSLFMLRANLQIINSAGTQGKINYQGNESIFFCMSGTLSIGTDGETNNILLSAPHGGLASFTGGTSLKFYGGTVETQKQCVYATGGGMVYLYGGSFTSTANSVAYVGNGGTMTISGGTYTAASGYSTVQLKGDTSYHTGNLTITGGTFNGSTHGIEVLDNVSSLETTGGTFTSTSGQSAFYLDGKGNSVKLSGGTFNGGISANVSLTSLLADATANAFYKDGTPISTNGMTAENGLYTVSGTVTIGEHKGHTFDETTHQCDCGTEAAAIVTTDGTKTDYATFAEALNAVNGTGGTVKLLQGVTINEITLTDCTLDLNGKRFWGSGVILITVTGNVTIINTADTQAEVYNSNNAGRNTIYVSYVGGHNSLTIGREDGSQSNIQFKSNGTVKDIAAGRNATVKIYGGEFGKAYAYSDATIKLYGGTFGSIETEIPFASLLGENRAFYSGETPFAINDLKADDSGNYTVTDTLTVKEHNDHSFDSATYRCIYCDAPATAVVTADGLETALFATVTDAVKDAMSKPGSILQLCADADLDDVSKGKIISVSNGSLTLDLNGHTLKGSGSYVLSVDLGGSLTVVNSSDAQATVQGTLGGITCQRNGNLTIGSPNGQSNILATATGGGGFTFCSGLNVYAGNVTVYGGTFTGAGYGLYVFSESSSYPVNVNISGGTFEKVFSWYLLDTLVPEGYAFYDGSSVFNQNSCDVDSTSYDYTVYKTDKTLTVGQHTHSTPDGKTGQCPDCGQQFNFVVIAASGESDVRGGYKTVEDALKAVNPGDELRVFTDFSTTGTVTLSKVMSIDLGSHKWNLGEGSLLSNKNGFIQISNGTISKTHTATADAENAVIEAGAPFGCTM